MPNFILEFLPPYSPDYNLIELVWHSAKEYIAHRLFESVEQLEELLHKLLNQGGLIVSPQNFGVGSYSGYHDQPNGFEEDFSRIRLPREGISPVFKIRSRIYSKKLIPNLRVVSTRDIKISQALVPC